MLPLIFLLCGCSGSFSIPPQPREVVPAGDVITINPDGGETISPPRQDPCLARARNFRGLVPMPCNLANEARP